MLHCTEMCSPIPLCRCIFLSCDTMSDSLPCDLKITLFSFHTWIYFNTWIFSVQPASRVGSRQVESELESCCSRPLQLCVSLTHMFRADNPWTEHPRAVFARPPHTCTHAHSQFALSRLKHKEGFVVVLHQQVVLFSFWIPPSVPYDLIISSDIM